MAKAKLSKRGSKLKAVKGKAAPKAARPKMSDEERKEHAAEYRKQYYADNKEKVLGYHKSYYENNKEKYKTWYAGWAKKNADKIKQYGINYRAKQALLKPKKDKGVTRVTPGKKGKLVMKTLSKRAAKISQRAPKKAPAPVEKEETQT